MLRLAADENFNGDIVRGLLRQLFGVSPIDPVSLLVSGAALTAAGLAANWPARRAMRVNPVTALRVS